MGKIMVTGYLNADDFAPEVLDPDHPTGLTDAGYEEVMGSAIEELTDVEIVFVKK